MGTTAELAGRLLDAATGIQHLVSANPDVHSASRHPLVGPSARRFVLRVLDHFAVHQREIHQRQLNLQRDLILGFQDLARQVQSGLRAQRQTIDDHAIQLSGIAPVLNRLGNELRALASTQVSTSAIQAERDKQFAVFSEAQGALESHITRLTEDVVRDIAELRSSLALLTNEVDVAADGVLRTAGVGPTRTVSVLGGRLRLPREDAVVLPWLLEHGSWEVEESELITKLLRGKTNFLDIGAHVGYYELLASAVLETDGYILAVEPCPRLVSLLEWNVQSNLGTRADSLVHVARVAAWDVDEELVLSADPGKNSGDNRVRPRGHAEGPVVPGRALAALDEIASRHWDVVKCDVQGRDHRALRGLLPVLQRDRPHVVTEFAPDDIEELGDDPSQVIDEYLGWGYAVRVVGGADCVRSEDAIEQARARRERFVSLWLIPD